MYSAVTGWIASSTEIRNTSAEHEARRNAEARRANQKRDIRLFLRAES
jgi:hypothetical protein